MRSFKFILFYILVASLVLKTNKVLINRKNKKKSKYIPVSLLLSIYLEKNDKKIIFFSNLSFTSIKKK